MGHADATQEEYDLMILVSRKDWCSSFIMTVEESYWEATVSIGAQKTGAWNTLSSFLRVILNVELTTYEGELSS